MDAVIGDKEIVLGVCGGIAAYKSVELLRLLKKANARVRVIMTANACRFVGPLTFEALSGRSVSCSLFDTRDGSGSSQASINHIEWAQSADAVIIAPATANMVAKLAHGIADDALSTLMLAVTAPAVICPAMNTHMFESAAVQRNLELLRQDGYSIVDPDSGELACGTTGPGRLPDPPILLDRLEAFLRPQDLSGRHVLVTAGPTWEPIDPVRFIGNPSSGKMGFALARAAEQRGARVVLVTGPAQMPDPYGVRIIRVGSAREMAAAVFENASAAEVIIKAAAVGDYRLAAVSDHKIKKGDTEMVLRLQPNEDILAQLGSRKGNRFVVGFAAETEHLMEYAQHKLVQKNLDMIVANHVNRPDTGFGVDTNAGTLLYPDGSNEILPLMSKKNLAHLLLDRIVARLSPGCIKQDAV